MYQFKYKRKRLKSMLALALSMAMVVTGPAQSLGSVYAEEAAAEESVETEAAELQTGDDAEVQTEVQNTEETVSAKTEGTAEEDKEEAPTEVEAVKTETAELQTDSDAAEETLEENTAETGAETGSETDKEAAASEADELQISGTQMNNAMALSLGKNIVTVKRSATGWYYFEPEKEGAYYVNLYYDEDGGQLNSLEGVFKISGIDSSRLMCAGDFDSDDNHSPYYNGEYYPRSELFIAKAGERVYFCPCSPPWDEKEADSDVLEELAMFGIWAAEEGTVSKDSDGKYTFSYTNGNQKEDFPLAISTTRTRIQLEISKKDDIYYPNGIKGNYELRTYCSNAEYGKAAILRYRYDDAIVYDGLDIGETYHMDYVLSYEWSEMSRDDPVVWFNFDITTNDTDKTGGEITNITADFASITVDYELFPIDTLGEGAWLRYKKDGAAEWEEYLEIYEDEEELSTGSEKLEFLDTDTRYTIELVSNNKKTVYDSRQITTEKYDGKVTATVNPNTIGGRSVGVDITGYDAKDETIQGISLTYQYADSFGESHHGMSGTGGTDIQSGTVTCTIEGLEPNTEYRDVRIWVRLGQRDADNREHYHYPIIYAGSVSFTTNEAAITSEDITATITPTGLTTADVRVEVKNIPAGASYRLECNYRNKGETDYWWRDGGSKTITADNNTLTFTLRDLEETDYELQYIIDRNEIAIQEVHFAPIAKQGNAKVAVTVKKAYANALELEAALTGVAANSTDTYTCRFQGYFYSCWDNIYVFDSTAGEVTLDPTKAVTVRFGVDTGAYSYSRWRYIVYKNGSEYDVGYLDPETTKIEPFALDITSLEMDKKYLYITTEIKNWSNVWREEDGEPIEFYAYPQLRKKGEKEWISCFNGDEGYLQFDENGVAAAKLCFSNEDYLGNWVSSRLDPAAQYELRLVSDLDCESEDMITVYGETTFKPTAFWEIAEENNFVYGGANTRRSIAITDNYAKPTVTVENDNIVSVREIRQFRIYLDVHTVGTTTLDVTADGVTKTVTVTVSPSAQMLFFFEGADETLADLKLPAQYAWVNPSESPKADTNKLQYFDVTINEANGIKYGKALVAVSTLEENGIEIQGRDAVGIGKESAYSAACTGKGFVETFDTEAEAYEITQEWTSDDGLEIKGDKTQSSVTVTGTKAGEHELTLTVRVKNFQTGKTLERKKVQKINVLGAGLIDNLVIQPAKVQPTDAIPPVQDGSDASGYTITGSAADGQVIDINCEDLDLSKTNKIQLEAMTERGTANAALEAVSVQWASASEELLAVDENGLVTVKGRGEGRLTVTAKDDGKYSVSLIVRIHNHAPIFDSTEITVRDGNSQGTKLDYQEETGNRVTKITLRTSGKLEAVKSADNNDWYLRTKAGYTEETTEQITLLITTENGKTYEQPLMVTVLLEPTVSVEADTSTGTIMFSQIAIPNLFYVNSEAVFTVSDTYEDYEIEDIRTVTKDKDAANFHVKGYDAKKKTVTLVANKLDTSTVASYAAKKSTNAVANVEVKFKGYDGYYPKDGNGISFNVAVQNKPVSALKAEDAFLTGSINTARVNVLDKKNVFDISGSSFEAVAKKTKAENLQVTAENGSLNIVQSGENAKGGNYTFNVSNPNWTKVLTLTGKISKVDVNKLAMKASKTKAVLNTKYNDSVTIDVSVKGNASLPVILDTEVKPATDALAVTTGADNKSITLGVAEGKTLASGKYTISVAGKIGEEKTKAVKITLTVTDKEPEVKLSAKGSINILNRDLSGITYTAAIKNTDAEIASAALTGESVNSFKLVRNDGKQLILQALKDTNDIDTKKAYEVKLNLALSNGAVIKDTKGVTLKVKPVDKLPKVKISAPKNPAISQAANEGVSVWLTMEQGYQIEKIELDGKDKDKFTVKMNGQGAFTISSAENVSSIDAKAYSLKYKLYFVGANAKTKQITKSIKITVSE